MPSSVFNNRHISDKTWYDPEDRTLASDGKPDNFKKDSKCRVVPIDLLVQKLPEGSDLHDILLGVMKRN